MVTFYQVSDSGEMKKVDFSDLSNFALKDECHLDGLSKDTLNFDELLDKGIYTYSDFDGTEKEDGNWPSALTSGYVVVMVEDDSRAQRGITQMVLDDNNGSYYRRGILSETENVFEDWHSLNANNNSITNLSLGKGSPSAIDGIWTEVSNLSYNIQLWKQINGISTMSTTSETNVILNGIETLALTGAQTIYVRDSTGTFSKLCLDISNGGTGATTAAGALTALGAASQTDLNSLRDSVDNMKYVKLGALGNITQSLVSQQLHPEGETLPQIWRLSMYGDCGAYMLLATEESLGLYNINTDSTVWRGAAMKLEHNSEQVTPSPNSFTNYKRYFTNTYKHAPLVALNVASSYNADGVTWANGINYSIQTITSQYFIFQIQNTNSVSGQKITMRWEVIGY